MKLKNSHIIQGVAIVIIALAITLIGGKVAEKVAGPAPDVVEDKYVYSAMSVSVARTGDGELPGIANVYSSNGLLDYIESNRDVFDTAAISGYDGWDSAFFTKKSLIFLAFEDVKTAKFEVDSIYDHDGAVQIDLIRTGSDANKDADQISVWIVAIEIKDLSDSAELVLNLTDK